MKTEAMNSRDMTSTGTGPLHTHIHNCRSLTAYRLLSSL